MITYEPNRHSADLVHLNSIIPLRLKPYGYKIDQKLLESKTAELAGLVNRVSYQPNRRHPLLRLKTRSYQKDQGAIDTSIEIGKHKSKCFTIFLNHNRAMNCLISDSFYLRMNILLRSFLFQDTQTWFWQVYSQQH